jgi:N4-gp56 family major capsid protein
MANEITSTTTSTDRDKFLAAKLLSNTSLKLVCASICDKVTQPKGSGLTAYFIRYVRMNVPVAALTEGTDPSNSTFTLAETTVVLDQWGDVITLTDVAELTTKHPLLTQAMDLLADNAQRVIDREVQIVWFAGTNIQYGDASVTTRRTITTAMKASDTIIHKARITLVDAGAAARGGPSGGTNGTSVAGATGTINGGSAYVGVCGPQVMGDIMQAGTSLGTWAAVAMYANQKALYNAEVGTWLGIRWVETNFIPKLTILGNTTAAVVSTASGGITGFVITAVDGGGALDSATTYFWKVTRKDLTRGFEEAISIAHSTASTATANNESFTFAMPSTAGYVYNVYFDTVQTGGTGTDATLKLAASNVAASATATITAVGSGATAPDNVNATGTPTIHPVYIHGADSCSWVSLHNLEVIMSGTDATTHNPLKLRRTIGYKFLSKAMIRNQNYMLRLELASTY